MLPRRLLKPRPTVALLLFCSSLPISRIAAAQTVAYWRFEDAQSIQAGQPLSVIADVSGSGNELRAFSNETAPTWTAAVPFDTVPQTAQPNRAAMDNTARPRRPFPTRDFFVVGSSTAFNLNTDPLPQWTIEASVLFKPIQGWQQRFQTFVGRDGYNVTDGPPLNENPLASLGFKKRGDTNCISIEAWDSSGQYVTVQSKQPVQPDVWYHVAAVCDGKTLALWIKGSQDQTYVLQDSKPFNGPLADTRGTWTVGRGCFASGPSEQFFGYLDEVRISAAALPTDKLLASPRAFGEAQAPAPTTLPKANLKPIPQFDAHLPRPPDAVPVHDPTIIEADGIYHVFASHGGLVHWRSKDLLKWERLPGVFADPPQWGKDDISPNPGLWAPDLAWFNNRFHLYYSVSTWGSQRSAIGLAVNDSLDPQDPKYKWFDQGKVIESFRGDDFNAIDPAAIVDPSGQPWLAWGSWNRGIFMARIDPQTGKLAAGEKPVQIAARPGNDALEAPHLFYHNGWYYLFVSYDLCCRGAGSTYKLMVGRSRQITGPYVDRDGKQMLQGYASLVVRSYGNLRGPGQSSITRRADQLFLVHHYYDARENGAPTLAVRPLYWDADGWPLAGEPLAEQATAAAHESMVGLWVQLLDDSHPATLSFRTDGSVLGPQGTGRWQRQGNMLKITWPSPDGGAHSPVIDECFVSDDGHSYVGRRSTGAIVRARLQLAAQTGEN